MPRGGARLGTVKSAAGAGGGAPTGAAGGDLGGTYPNPSVLQAGTTWALAGIITPTTLAANTDDWAPTGGATANRIRASSSSAVNLTGITGGFLGRVLVLANVGGFTITLKHDVTSTAANRFYCSGDADVAMTPDSELTLIYDATSSRWRVQGHSRLVGTADLVANAVTLAKLATQPDQTVLGNVAGSVAVPTALTAAQVITILQGQVGGIPLFGELASDLLFTVSSTAFQNITGMSFPIGASATEIWLVEIYAELSGANITMDAKFQFTVPAAATMRWGGQVGASGNNFGYGSLSAATSNLALITESGNLPIGTGAASAIFGVALVGKVYGGGTPGTVQLQGSQNTSDPGQLTAKAGSILRATKIKA